MRELSRTDRFLVAEKDGKFLHFKRGGGAAEYGWTEYPSQANRVTPYKPAAPLEEPSYYFENSPLMKEIMEGAKMVWVAVTTCETVTDDYGPTRPISEKMPHFENIADYWDWQDEQLYLNRAGKLGG